MISKKIGKSANTSLRTMLTADQVDSKYKANPKLPVNNSFLKPGLKCLETKTYHYCDIFSREICVVTHDKPFDVKFFSKKHAV